MRFVVWGPRLRERVSFELNREAFVPGNQVAEGRILIEVVGLAGHARIAR
jgi:hypothetical protein